MFYNEVLLLCVLMEEKWIKDGSENSVVIFIIVIGYLIVLGVS